MSVGEIWILEISFLYIISRYKNSFINYIKEISPKTHIFNPFCRQIKFIKPKINTFDIQKIYIVILKNNTMKAKDNLQEKPPKNWTKPKIININFKQRNFTRFRN